VLLLLLITATIDAGVVRGVVLEYASGLPLARTIVRLQPIPGPGVSLKSHATRAGVSGQFFFSAVPDGQYLLIAVRPSYFPAGHGQRRPDGQGTPIEVTRDSDLFADLRMRRKGAISGRVLDENGVGLPGVPVVAYRARMPLRTAGRAQADDRGVYRIHGLDPGKYWIRTAPYTLDDGSGRLPTFGPESRETKDARTHRVRLDEDTPDADVRPEPGRLFRFRGAITCTDPPGTKVIVMLSSDTGRRRTEAACMGRYSFEGLGPAFYEVHAETVTGNDSGFIEMFLDHDSEVGTVQLSRQTEVDFDVRRAGVPGRASIDVQLSGRRMDLSEADDVREIPLPRAKLAPGRWEFTARVAPGQFIESIGDPRFFTYRRLPRPERHPDWFEVLVEARATPPVPIIVSDKAGQLTGMVVGDRKSVPGAPVFLWPVAEQTRRQLGGARQTLSDTEGRFRFEGLPPGNYRLLASFDLSEPDDDVIEEARAAAVQVEPTRITNHDLPLWMAP
jgi:protocatechuate 3,4-dioxygenase beta subunit